MSIRIDIVLFRNGKGRPLRSRRGPADWGQRSRVWPRSPWPSGARCCSGRAGGDDVGGVGLERRPAVSCRSCSRAYSKRRNTTRSASSTTGNGGNAGVQDVQAHRSQFAVQTRPPLKSDCGTTYVKLFLDGLCIAVNRSNQLSNASIGQVEGHLPGDRHELEPGAGFRPVDDDRRRSGATRAPACTRSSSRRFSAGRRRHRTCCSRRATALWRPRCTGTRTRSDTSDSLTRAPATASRTSRSTASRAMQAHIKNESYPLFRYIWGCCRSRTRTFRSRSSSTGCGRARPRAGIINRAGAVPAFNKH